MPDDVTAFAGFLLAHMTTFMTLSVVYAMSFERCPTATACLMLAGTTRDSLIADSHLSLSLAPATDDGHTSLERLLWHPSSWVDVSGSSRSVQNSDEE